MTSTERMAVVGTGLIGTSIAMAAARAGARVRGFDADPDVLARAAARGGFEAATGLAEAVRGADLAFICTPIPTIAHLAAEVVVEAPDAVVSDAGSVKSEVIAEVEATVADASRFVGGHPMGGSELSGPEGASASLLDGIAWVLTPTERTDAAAVARVERWVAGVGAEVMRMSPGRHDRMVAVVSHLPQVASTVLMGLAATEEADEPEILLLAAGGFRDLTRLAASDAGLWSSILLANREQIAQAIDLYVDRLRSLRDDVVGSRGDAVRSTFAHAKEARLRLATKPQVKSGVAVLQVEVPDRPGALAELTSILAEDRVNIEDLQIVHSPEGGRGTVHITVATGDADTAASAIAGRGYEPTRLA